MFIELAVYVSEFFATLGVPSAENAARLRPVGHGLPAALPHLGGDAEGQPGSAGSAFDRTEPEHDDFDLVGAAGSAGLPTPPTVAACDRL